MPQEKNNLNTKQTVKEWTYSEYIERFTIFLAESRESMIKIIYSMFILVALAMFSLITNSSTSEAVVWPAKTLEDNIYYSSFQKYIVKTTCMFLRVYHLYQWQQWE